MKRVSAKMSKTLVHGSFAESLLEWWKSNQRDFPWRKTRDPYRILVSEILLQRTRANQVTPVYIDFLARFPTMTALCGASVENVKNTLRPLGLSWRTELVHKMALQITEKHEGKIPSRKEELEALPGVGQYIAAAVRCFCYGFPEILLDTNTVRIVARIFGIEKTDSSRRSRYYRELYGSLIDKEHPRDFNYAMIDLGALVCVSRKPACDACPLSRFCGYRQSQKAQA